MLLENFKAALASGKLKFVEREASELLRLSMRPISEPYFGKSRAARWDDPLGEYGVTYAALTLEVAFAETILHENGLYDRGEWMVPEAKVKERSIVYLACERRLSIADLTGPALKAMGLDNQVSAGTDYALTSQVSRAVFEAVPGCDGIRYMSRHNNTGEAVAIFDRSGVGIHPARTRSLLGHEELPELLTRFGVELLPDADAPGSRAPAPARPGLKRIR